MGRLISILILLGLSACSPKAAPKPDPGYINETSNSHTEVSSPIRTVLNRAFQVGDCGVAEIYPKSQDGLFKVISYSGTKVAFKNDNKQIWTWDIETLEARGVKVPCSEFEMKIKGDKA